MGKGACVQFVAFVDVSCIDRIAMMDGSTIAEI
jgi:hypothetical protein